VASGNIQKAAADTIRNGSVQPLRPSQDKPTDPTTPVSLVDDQGRPVIGAEGVPVLRPAGLDPHLFVTQGLEERKFEEDVRRDGGYSRSAEVLGFMIGKLRKFRQFGPWDAQRIGGIYHDEYVDYSTIVIGLYAAAAGLSKTEILEVQNVYARLHSSYKQRTEYDRVYTYLPARNVKNTDIGYQLYESGRIQADAKQ
jgi:hypothetical protein